MRFSLTFAAGLLALGQGVAARDVPTNVRNFYHRAVANEKCPRMLQGGFHSSYDDSKDFGYCQDKKSGALYLQGQHSQLANMDIDCDGKQGGPGEDGRCGSSSDTQSQTSFKDTVAEYGAGIDDLNAKVHSYVVFGNEGTNPSFKPDKYNIKPLSVMAVVCGNKLFYGVWGDTNGNDGQPVVGEASISLATACFGKQRINGNAAHDDNDVLFIAFPGEDAVPGPNGAKWDAKSFNEFEQSITDLGNKLIAKL